MEINVLAESLLKIEKIKEDPDDFLDEAAIEYHEPSALKLLVKKEDDDEELELPAKVFVEDTEFIKEEVMEEEEDPLAISVENCSVESKEEVKHSWSLCRDEQRGVHAAGRDTAVQLGGACSFETGAELQLQKRPAAKPKRCASRENTSEETTAEGASLSDAPANLSAPAMTRSSDRIYKCSICKKGLSEKHNLLKHMRVHTGEEPFQCSICMKSFSESSNLSRHMRFHTEERQFECRICKKNFYLKHHLVKHTRIHTGEKSLECSICKKRFSEKGHLVRHMRVHTEEKPFKCSICKKSFSEKGHLDRHMRVHTGQKPFECSVCKKRFSENGALVVHMRVHTGEKPFQCSICKKSFSQNHSLLKHMRVHAVETL